MIMRAQLACQTYLDGKSRCLSLPGCGCGSKMLSKKNGISASSWPILRKPPAPGPQTIFVTRDSQPKLTGRAPARLCRHLAPEARKPLAMGRKPHHTRSEHPDPTTNIVSEMGGEFICKMGSPLGLTHSHFSTKSKA